jgi:ribosomal protein L7Ae-like RNA K-turn-binding protein
LRSPVGWSRIRWAKCMRNEKIQGLLGLGYKARAVAVGSRDTRDQLRHGEIRLVLLAEDGSPRDRERVRRVAREAGVPARVLAKRDDLGRWMGRGPVAVLGIRDSNLAAALLSNLDGEPAESEGGNGNHG